MKKLIPKENQYPNLAEFLRAGGKLVVGENHHLGTFAQIQMDRETHTVERMNYDDLADVLNTMEHQAKCFIEENW